MTMRTGRLGKPSSANAPGAAATSSHAARAAPIRQLLMTRSPALIVLTVLSGSVRITGRMPPIPLAGKGGGDPAKRGWIARYRDRCQEEALSAATFRTGIVIAATPITTQPRP